MMHKVAIHSVPRSGSTWLGEIFNSHRKTKYCFQPLFSYKFKDYLTSASSTEEVDKFFKLLGDTTDEFVSQKSQRDSGSLPIFEKESEFTHIVYKEVRYHNLVKHLCELESDLKFIFLVRNPVDVMNSWINAPKEFDSTWDVSHELFKAQLKNEGKPENYYGLDAWIETTLLFEVLSQRFSDRVKLVNYDSLKKQPVTMSKSLFEFCSLSFEKSTEKFLHDSGSKEVEGAYSVFRGGGKSRLNLSEELVEQIKSRVQAYGLEHYIV